MEKKYKNTQMALNRMEYQIQNGNIFEIISQIILVYILKLIK